MPTHWIRSLFGLAFALTLCLPAGAERTRVWTVSEHADLLSGEIENLAVSSDGRVRLARAIEEIHDSPASYIWDLAVGPDGAVYAALGPEARVVRVGADGRSEVVFETNAVEVHAIVVDPSGILYAATNPSGKVFRVTPDGAASVLYDPGAAAIWDLALGPDGALYIAAGDGGSSIA